MFLKKRQQKGNGLIGKLNKIVQSSPCGLFENAGFNQATMKQKHARGRKKKKHEGNVPASIKVTRITNALGCSCHWCHLDGQQYIFKKIPPCREMRIYVPWLCCVQIKVYPATESAVFLLLLWVCPVPRILRHYKQMSRRDVPPLW